MILGHRTEWRRSLEIADLYQGRVGSLVLHLAHRVPRIRTTVGLQVALLLRPCRTACRPVGQVHSGKRESDTIRWAIKATCNNSLAVLWCHSKPVSVRT